MSSQARIEACRRNAAEGGKRTKELYGSEHFRTIGADGGKATALDMVRNAWARKQAQQKVPRRRAVSRKENARAGTARRPQPTG